MPQNQLASASMPGFQCSPRAELALQLCFGENAENSGKRAPGHGISTFCLYFEHVLRGTHQALVVLQVVKLSVLGNTEKILVNTLGRCWSCTGIRHPLLRGCFQPERCQKGENKLKKKHHSPAQHIARPRTPAREPRRFAFLQPIREGEVPITAGIYSPGHKP